MVVGVGVPSRENPRTFQKPFRQLDARRESRRIFSVRLLDSMSSSFWNAASLLLRGGGV